MPDVRVEETACGPSITNGRVSVRVRLRPVAKKDGALYVTGGDGVRKVEISGLVAERVVEQRHES